MAVPTNMTPRPWLEPAAMPVPELLLNTLDQLPSLREMYTPTSASISPALVRYADLHAYAWLVSGWRWQGRKSRAKRAPTLRGAADVRATRRRALERRA